jgi:hypothetical protein
LKSETGKESNVGEKTLNVVEAEERTKEERAIAKRPAGFTLSEVVVASALVIIAIVPILKALSASHLNTIIIERKTRSLTLAQGKLNEIKARSIYNYGDTFAETNTPVDGLYLCSVTDVAADPNLREITVTVGYDVNGGGDLGADEISVSLATYLAKRW